jgi:hypothetical protein
MNELEKAWPELIADAVARARGAGRHDMADFLALKGSNDLIRTAAIKWLFDSIIEVASRAQSKFPMLTIDREEPHSFGYRGARVTGSILRMRLGVRCLTVEAGWTRTPNDGFMRGGALAFAKITHFGMPKQNVELLLLKGDNAPAWNIVTGDDNGVFESAAVEEHFAIFME